MSLVSWNDPLNLVNNWAMTLLHMQEGVVGRVQSPITYSSSSIPLSLLSCHGLYKTDFLFSSSPFPSFFFIFFVSHFKLLAKSKGSSKLVLHWTCWRTLSLRTIWQEITYHLYHHLIIRQKPPSFIRRIKKSEIKEGLKRMKLRKAMRFL